MVLSASLQCREFSSTIQDDLRTANDEASCLIGAALRTLGSERTACRRTSTRSQGKVSVSQIQLSSFWEVWNVG